MKPDTLEKLLLDRALGELSPEAEELLAAWCAEHPADAVAADALAATVALAREATADHAPAPALPRPTWHRAAWRPLPAEILRLAACLALGLSLGWFALPRPPVAAETVAAPGLVTVAAVDTAPRPSPSAFWSISARIAEARRDSATARPAAASSYHPAALFHFPQPEPQS
jgi:anti-sigma factor RsiW